LAAAKSKADEIEAKLNSGGDFGQLARTFSDGPTAADGGNLGQFQRGALAKVLEDSTFSLKAGQFTQPIRTRQGFVILKVVQHTQGGVPEFKDVQNQVEEAFYEARMEPAMRAYLTKMREEAYMDIKPGYTDTGASPHQTKPVYSAYVPPAPKKKKKVERTRFRETTRTFRQKTPVKAEPAEAAAATPAAAPAPKPEKGKKKASGTQEASMKPGKKEKIRFGQAPTKTLPATSGETKTEDAGAGQPQETAAAETPANPLESNAQPERKTRFSDRAKAPKQAKTAAKSGVKVDPMAPAPPDSAEVADRQTQAAPLGLAGNTAKAKKKKSTTTGDKTRLSQKKKTETQPTGDQPLGPAPQPQPQAPAPQAPAATPPAAPQAPAPQS
jgi:peptidyl-prolyl cis-trans isomerase SurA